MRIICLHKSFDHKKCINVTMTTFVAASTTHSHCVMLGVQRFSCLFYFFLCFSLHSLKLTEVLDLLDLKEPQCDVYYITVIPTVEKDAIESDCDCSDREYQGETGHLPTRLLNGEAEVTYLEDEKILT